LASLSWERSTFSRQYYVRTLRGVFASTETERVPGMTILECILKNGYFFSSKDEVFGLL